MRCTFAYALALLVVMIVAQSCGQQAPDHPRVVAANGLTDRYACSSLAGWNVRVHAAGADCGVLFIEIAAAMQDTTIEAMHYGIGPYAIDRGGVLRFAREQSFRAIAYRDSLGRTWTYGAISEDEKGAFPFCR